MKTDKFDIIRHIQNNQTDLVMSYLKENFDYFASYARKRCGMNESDAQLIYHSGFNIFIQNVKSGSFIKQSNCNPLTYLVSICKKIMFKAYRKQKRGIKIIKTAVENVELPDESATEKSHEQQHWQALTKQCLSHLPPKHLKLLEYRILDRQSYKEIALLLDYKNAAVARSQYKRCIQELREKYPAMTKRMR